MADRPYQTKLTADIYNAWGSGARNVCAVLPTGGGKSHIVSGIVHNEHAAGATQCVIAHRVELVSQMSMHIASRGIPHRIIAPSGVVKAIDAAHREEFNGRSFVNPRSQCSVAGVDTLISRFDDPDIVTWSAQVTRWITDESHHLLANNKWGRAAAMFPNAYGLGVTATPSRADGMGLGRHHDGIMDALVFGPSMRELIDAKYLSDYEIVCPTSDLVVNDDDISAGGDYSPKKLAEASKKSRIVGDVVEQWFKHALHKRTIVFVTDVETAGKVAQNFKAKGVAAEAISAKTPSSLRDELVRRFKNGRITILINVDLFGEGFDCLDVETEVLTPNGWKDILSASLERECYAWNHSTNEMEIVPIDNWAMRPVRPGEQMWTVKSQHADIRVTAGHRIYSRKLNHFKSDGMSEMVQVRTAKEVYNDAKAFAVPLSAPMSFPGIPLSDDELKLIGWYITDGYILRGHTLTISQSKDNGIKEITAILDRLGMDYRTRMREPNAGGYANGKPSCEFSIPKGVHGGTLARKGWGYLADYMTKTPSPLLHGMTREQFAVFWAAMMAGDGSQQVGKSGTLTVSMKVQADTWVHMATIRGFAAMYGTYTTANDVTIYNVRIRDEQWLRMKPTDARGAKFDLQPASDGEVVWCLTNRLGTLVTRRRGKIAILGNCPAVECVIMARPTASLGVYLQQFGRALRLLEGKLFGLVIDMVSNFKRHNFPDKKHLWTLDRRDKRAKRQPDPEDVPLTGCTECSRPYLAVLPACPHCGHEPVVDPRARGTIEQVDGDLVLLDREALARLRAAMELPSAGDVAARAGAAAGHLAAAGAANRQIERIGAQTRLREAIELWAGHQRALGRDDRQSYRRFYAALGVDVLSALALSRAEMDKLSDTVDGWIK